MVEFVWLPTFERTSKKLLNEEDRRLIEMELCGDSRRETSSSGPAGSGSSVSGRRVAGKSGGVRVIYFPDEECGRVYMILAYGKGKKETLTRREEHELRNWPRT